MHCKVAKLLFLKYSKYTVIQANIIPYIHVRDNVRVHVHMHVQVNQQYYAPTQSYYGQQQSTATTGQTSQSSQAYAVAQSTQVGGVSTSGTGQTSQTSISDMLAAASERVLERCGLEYDEMAGMYYDANSALYYDQVWGGDAPVY